MNIVDKIMALAHEYAGTMCKQGPSPALKEAQDALRAAIVEALGAQPAAQSPKPNYPADETLLEWAKIENAHSQWLDTEEDKL